MQTTKRLLLILFSFLVIVPLCLSQPVRGSDDGGQSGGNNVDPIDIHFPPCGHLANIVTKFRWSPKDGATTYTVQVKEPQADGTSTVIQSIESNNTAVLLDLPSMDLTVGKEYNILVTSDNDKRSNEASFVLRSIMDKKQLYLDLTADRRYSLMSGLNKSLRKAELLREKNWNYEAYKSYNIEVDNLKDIIKVNDHFQKYVNDLFPSGADGCAGM